MIVRNHTEAAAAKPPCSQEGERIRPTSRAAPCGRIIIKKTACPCRSTRTGFPILVAGRGLTKIRESLFLGAHHLVEHFPVIVDHAQGELLLVDAHHGEALAAVAEHGSVDVVHFLA